MNSLRIWIIISWIALPVVMLGGYALLRRIVHGDVWTPFQVTFFRAGHAHAAVLLLLSLLYYQYLDRTVLSPGVKFATCAVLFAGILAQSGGFFLHMFVGQPGQASIGTTVTMVGALLLAGAILFLVYGLMTTPR